MMNDFAITSRPKHHMFASMIGDYNQRRHYHCHCHRYHVHFQSLASVNVLEIKIFDKVV